MPASLLACYDDVPSFLQNASMQLETQTLVGLNTTIASATKGATSLSVASVATLPGTTTTPFVAYILDGAQSEIVTVDTQVGTAFTLASALLATHSSGVSISTAGALGCLADIILNASRQVDLICMQGPDASADLSLYATSRTETYYCPSMRAVIDRDYTLIVKPYHFPITSFSSLTVQQSASMPFAVNTTNMPSPLPYGMKVIHIPFLQPVGNTVPSQYIVHPFNRAVGSYVTLTYIGGPIGASDLASVPYDIRDATRLLVADALGWRSNNLGAATVRIGDVNITSELRGGTAEGHSRLRAQAIDRLRQYRTPVGM